MLEETHGEIENLASQVTPFDNRYSLLYKASYIQDTIARFIIIIGPPDELTSYITLTKAITEYLTRTQDLRYIYNSTLGFSLTGLNFSPLDFIYNYVSVLSPEEIVLALREINAFLNKEGLVTFRDVNTLDQEYHLWREKVVKQKEKEVDYLNFVLELQNLYTETEPLPVSDISFNRITVIGRPTFLSKEEISSSFNNTAPTADLGEEIFDQATVSPEVPIILYTDHNDKTFSKIFSEFTLKTLLPETPPLRNTFFILIWTGTGNEKVTKDSFTICHYDLNDNQFSIDIPIRNGKGEEIVLSRIKSSLPIEIEETTVVRTGGDFRIYGINLIEPLFLSNILLSPIYYAYLYISEDSKAAYEKKKLSVHMRTLPIMENPRSMPTQTDFSSTVTAVINSYKTSGEAVKILTPQGVEERNLPAGTPYLICSITRANNGLDALQFMEVFNRICVLYMQDLPDILRSYQALFPEAKYTTVEKEKRYNKSNRSTLSQLYQLAPDVFLPGYYARSTCQGSHQPLIIPDEEVTEWKNKTFKYKGSAESLHRQVMRFPPENPKILPRVPRFNIVCPTNEQPFPGVKVNNGSNKDKYPFVPCCFGSDQMNPDANSNYNEYYRGIQRKSRASSSKTRIITSKILEFGRTGNLPNALTSFFSSFFQEETDFLRVGVPRNINSAISCLLLANNKELLQGTPRNISSLAEEFRRSLDFYPALLKQEFYDLNDEEIMERVYNENLFFDPYFFYRALEESFDVNIITFTMEKDVPIIEIPRHMIYFSHVYRDRPLVLLYKNFGSESDALLYPQIELIANSKQNNYFFTGDINRRLFDAFNTFSTVYFWTPLYVEKGSSFSTELSFADFATFFPEAQGQILDEYGKLRGLVTKDITVYFPPSQPLNLPVVKGGKSKEKVIIDLFGEPTAASYEGDKVTGLWYPGFNFAYVFYFPLEGTTTLSLPLGPENPFPPLQPQALIDYSSLIHKRNIILQLISWLFILSKEEWPEENVLEWFTDKYLLIGDEEKSNYSFSSLARVFPPVKIKEALVYLSHFPGLVRENRLYLYNKKFTAGVLYFLESILKSYSRDKLRVPKEIFGIPYRTQPLTLLFENWEHARKWEKENSMRHNLEVHTRLTEVLGKQKEPYFYFQDRLYLIQNSNSMDSALYISLYWLEHHINIADKAEPFTGSYPNILYNITPDGSLGMIEDNSQGNSNFAQIIQYNGERYGSLLRL